MTGMPDLEELRDTWEFIYLWIILKSIGISAFTAVIALIVGYPAAYYIARRGDRQKHFLLFLVTLPFFTRASVAQLESKGIELTRYRGRSVERIYG